MVRLVLGNKGWRVGVPSEKGSQWFFWRDAHCLSSPIGNLQSQVSLQVDTCCLSWPKGSPNWPQLLPLLPHVWKNWDPDQVSKIPPDVKLWQWQILESSSSEFLTWSSKCQHSRGTGFGTWDLMKVPKELMGVGGRRRGDNVRVSPTILIPRPSVNP